MTSLAHRGGLASGRGEGDGAGLLLPLPLDFLSRFWTLPSVFGFGQLFLPRDAVAEKKAMDIVREALAAHDLELKDGRDVPVRPEALGPQGARTNAAYHTDSCSAAREHGLCFRHGLQPSSRRRLSSA